MAGSRLKFGVLSAEGGAQTTASSRALLPYFFDVSRRAGRSLHDKTLHFLVAGDDHRLDAESRPRGGEIGGDERTVTNVVDMPADYRTVGAGCGEQRDREVEPGAPRRRDTAQHLGSTAHPAGTRAPARREVRVDQPPPAVPIPRLRNLAQATA
jgi:hypothetical protein